MTRRLFAAIAMLLVAVARATNPVSGRREFDIVYGSRAKRSA